MASWPKLYGMVDCAVHALGLRNAIEFHHNQAAALPRIRLWADEFQLLRGSYSDAWPQQRLLAGAVGM